uniref:Uncharacterized protein n=1 Tax=Setaria digitata TaxID=48799 RepID=A0A915PES8_9BILA
MTSAEQFAPEISNYYYDQQQTNPARVTATSNNTAAPTPQSGPSYYPNAQYNTPDSSQHGPVGIFTLWL